ncbi:hypothetical protein [Phenylobacterium sp.]|uniref:hypothetical protein n=1 Tax=Phenylobacterium sp. TaxID=1871053 RepID=UPI0025D35CD9|nr:hypothetical protein [Phenylobacterium sp.]
MAADADDELAAQEPSEEEFARWLRPFEFLALRGNLGPHSAVEVIEVRLSGGLLPVAAGLTKFTRNGEEVRYPLAMFPHEWWHRVPHGDPHLRFWTAPVVDVIQPGVSGRQAMRLTRGP